MLANISLALSSLKKVSQLRRRIILLTSDDLFSRFVEFIPLLSPSALAWYFSLVTLFFHALPLELKDAATPGYILPDLSTLINPLSQE